MLYLYPTAVPEVAVKVENGDIIRNIFFPPLLADVAGVTHFLTICIV
jgi:hypothetical protein